MLFVKILMVLAFIFTVGTSSARCLLNNGLNLLDHLALCIKVLCRQYHNMPPILYYTTLYYTILYYTIVYYAILYCTALYRTVLHCSALYLDPTPTSPPTPTPVACSCRSASLLRSQVSCTLWYSLRLTSR